MFTGCEEVLAFSLPCPFYVLRSRPAWSDLRGDVPLLDMMAAARLELRAPPSPALPRHELGIPSRPRLSSPPADPIPPLFTLFPLVWTRQHEVSRFRGFERTRAAQFTSASIEKENGSRVLLAHSFLPYTPTGQVLELSRGDTRFCTLTRAQVGRVASS